MTDAERYNIRPHASCDNLTPAQAQDRNGVLPKRWKSKPRKPIDLDDEKKKPKSPVSQNRRKQRPCKAFSGRYNS